VASPTRKIEYISKINTNPHHNLYHTGPRQR
jgi:hypothetical protein